MSMQHSAEVAADCHVAGDKHRLVPVILSNVSACRQCARGGGCGAGLLALGQRQVELQCRTHQSLRRGQRVTIETDDSGSAWLQVVLTAFGLPILGLGLGMMFGSLAAAALPVADTADWPAAVGALVGLAGGVLAWQKVAPLLDQRASTGLCHHSARIVNIDSDS